MKNKKVQNWKANCLKAHETNDLETLKLLLAQSVIIIEGAVEYCELVLNENLTEKSEDFHKGEKRVASTIIEAIQVVSSSFLEELAKTKH